MSVYTPVDQEQLHAFLKEYPLGPLISYQGISAGIENTNYFVTTEEGEFVLTLFETLGMDELPYFLNLMAYLAEHNITSAHPIADRSGSYLRTLLGKPTTLVKRLKGSSINSPTTEHCSALGEALGQLHQVGQDFSNHRDNERGPHWWKEMALKLAPHISNEASALITDEINHQHNQQHADLPRGVIHADLFRDNALFTDKTLTGIIDFYYACNDILLYDVAVTINDWCINTDGSLNDELTRAFLSAYHQARPFTAAENKAWPLMLRAGALRFWLSRLHDLHFQREGEITHTKDPYVFKNIMAHHRNHERSLDHYIDLTT